MRFDARELAPYAEPVSVDKLRVGEIYFSIQFIDDEMRVPVMETLVFLGVDISAEGKRYFQFQDAESHRDGIRSESDHPERGRFYDQPPDSMKHLFEFDKALDRLLACSLRRGDRAS